MGDKPPAKNSGDDASKKVAHYYYYYYYYYYGLTSWHLVQPYLCSDPGQVAYLLGSGLLSLSSLITVTVTVT